MAFAVRVFDLLRDALHREILEDSMQDALAGPSCPTWAAQVVKHVQSLGLPAPSGIHVQLSLTSPVFVAILLAYELRSGLAGTLPLDLHLPKRPRCARVIADLRALVQCRSHSFSCP